MKITIGELRRLIREALDDVEESHEDPADPDVAQMNRQGDGNMYDQMGRSKLKARRAKKRS